MHREGIQLTVFGSDVGGIVKSEKCEHFLVIHKIGTDQLGTTLINSGGQVFKLASPGLAWQIPLFNRLAGQRIDRWAALIEVECTIRLLAQDLTGSVAEELMEDYPNVVCWELVLLKSVSFMGIDEWVGELVATLCSHAICDDDVLEAAILSDVVILRC